MNSKIKRSAKGRVLTLIDKIEELRRLGDEDTDLRNLLPCNIQDWEERLMDVYVEIL